MGKSTNEVDIPDPDPRYKEQTDGILYAFANENYRVLTTTEIANHLDIGRRQVERRLKDLNDLGIVESRKPGRTRLWWLEAEVEEPVTVSYPIVKLVRERISLQFIALGVVSGIITLIYSTAAIIAGNYDIAIWIIDFELFVTASLLASLFGAMMFLVGGVIASISWFSKHLGLEIQIQRKN